MNTSNPQPDPNPNPVQPTDQPTDQPAEPNLHPTYTDLHPTYTDLLAALEHLNTLPDDLHRDELRPIAQEYGFSTQMLRQYEHYKDRVENLQEIFEQFQKRPRNRHERKTWVEESAQLLGMTPSGLNSLLRRFQVFTPMTRKRINYAKYRIGSVSARRARFEVALDVIAGYHSIATGAETTDITARHLRRLVYDLLEEKGLSWMDLKKANMAYRRKLSDEIEFEHRHEWQGLIDRAAPPNTHITRTRKRRPKKDEKRI